MGDCVPYAAHAVSGVPFEDVKELAASMGWSQEGMGPIQGWYLLKELGCKVSPLTRPSGKASVGEFLRSADPGKVYILSLNDHWMAVVRGQVWDKARTRAARKVVHFIEVYSEERSAEDLRAASI
ncbi:hypothetical protein L4Z64_001217 [Pseudomonas aeruginosa]|nr:hypothetical protein [Pseudomonas aeruginosa]